MRSSMKTFIVIILILLTIFVGDYYLNGSVVRKWEGKPPTEKNIFVASCIKIALDKRADRFKLRTGATNDRIEIMCECSYDTAKKRFPKTTLTVLDNNPDPNGTKNEREVHDILQHCVKAAVGNKGEDEKLSKNSDSGDMSYKSSTSFVIESAATKQYKNRVSKKQEVKKNNSIIMYSLTTCVLPCDLVA